jgi:hypothetical protein
VVGQRFPSLVAAVTSWFGVDDRAFCPDHRDGWAGGEYD